MPHYERMGGGDWQCLTARATPVPAKSSESRAILLLILGHTEHLWIRVKIVFVKARKTSKESLASNHCAASSLLLQQFLPRSGVKIG
jgi:hypothetical protein